MPSFHEIVERLGGHPSRALGLDLGDDPGLWRWLVAACLLAGPGPEAVALATYRSLEDAALLDLDALARVDPRELAERLAATGGSQPERTASVLTRLARTLIEVHAGSPAALLDAADDLDAAGAALVGLAPGLGPGTALRFLRPLRERRSAARETPLSATARAAARHLGWIAEAEDEEGAPVALAAALARDLEAPDPADVEAALERLGRRSCGAERPDRCPLAEACPLR